ncbi:MAG: NADH-quinone oxidoreductase subunit B [Deltaproteobacteria bacterium]|nr:NADH-quinone oxidoreductase subunit B [Deltaproteobacteria bacterium]
MEPGPGYQFEEVPARLRHPILDTVLDHCRANSLWPVTFGLACCAIEMMALGMARWDLSRWGAEVFRPSPRQADLLIVAGTVNKKMAPVVLTLYEQMPSPKWVLAMGNCAMSGGPFKIAENYNVVEGVDRLIPVDVYVPGCPPRPEGLLEGILKLQEKISGVRHPFPQFRGLLAPKKRGTAHAGKGG